MDIPFRLKSVALTTFCVGICMGQGIAGDIASAILFDPNGQKRGTLKLTTGLLSGTSNLKIVIPNGVVEDGVIIGFMELGKCDFDKLNAGGKFVREGADYEIFLRDNPLGYSKNARLDDAAAKFSIVKAESKITYFAKGIDLDPAGSDKKMLFDEDGTVVSIDVVTGTGGYSICGQLLRDK